MASEKNTNSGAAVGTSSQKQGKQQQAKQKAKQTAGKAQQKAGELAGQAKQKAQSQVETQKSRATDQLGHVVKALRQTGDNLRSEEQEKMATYTDKAADQVESISGYLEGRSPQELMQETERFARRDPALFIGGAFALGILGARFLKSSSPSGSGASGSSSSDSSESGAPQQGSATQSSAMQGADKTRVYNEPAAAGTPQ